MLSVERPPHVRKHCRCSSRNGLSLRGKSAHDLEDRPLKQGKGPCLARRRTVPPHAMPTAHSLLV